MAGRGRVRGVVARRVDDLSSRRDALDAEHAERRAREDTALELWAGLTVRRDEIETAREGELHRLETERIRVRDEAVQRVARVEADQAAVLLELNRDGRTVDQLSALFGLPLKQVRTMLRAARSTASDAAGDSVQAPGEVARQTTATGADSVPAVVPHADAAPNREPDGSAARAGPWVEGTVGELPGTEQSDGDADFSTHGRRRSGQRRPRWSDPGNRAPTQQSVTGRCSDVRPEVVGRLATNVDVALAYPGR